MNESMERVLDLVQLAEDVSKGIDSPSPLFDQDALRFGAFDLEPLPIGPNGIEKVVSQIPSFSWDCTSHAKDLASAFRGAAFPVSLHDSSRDATASPLHNKKEVPYTNGTVSAMNVPKRELPSESPIAATAILRKPLMPSLSPLVHSASVVSRNSISTIAATDLDKGRYRTYQTGQWNDRFEELMEFRAAHGHLFVPHTYPPNQKLAQWVKR